jgi:hypothetical protein
LQLHEPAPAFEQVHDMHALPPVQSRGVPPPQLPALHIWPTVQYCVEHEPVDGDQAHAPAEHIAPVSHTGVVATQSAHAPPPLPHAETSPPAAQLPPAQQPRHGPAAQAPPATQVELAVAQIAPTAQLPTPVQPQWPVTHALPSIEVVQLPHFAPPVPQLVGDCDPYGTQAPLAQQPFAHEAALHTHAPPEQASPLPHEMHATPPLPQAPITLPGWHMPLASQQPFLQELELHAPQVWLLVSQVWPPAQSPLPLQPHTPPARQAWPTALRVQSTQVALPPPHAVGIVPVAQLPPGEQQPVQEPSPGAPHAGVHAPAAHVGVTPVQGAQFAPPVPQLPLLCAAGSTQLVPLQQPPAHEPGVHAHAPATQACVLAQPAHIAPPVPHAPTSLPGWHTPFASQQPFGQVDLLQTHAPPTHAVPLPQVAHARPPVPHAPTIVPGWHMPLPSQQPLPHIVESQVQTPDSHDCPVEHGAQLAPALPHEVGVCEANGTHTPLAQQPFGQEFASQAHCPDAHD